MTVNLPRPALAPSLPHRAEGAARKIRINTKNHPAMIRNALGAGERCVGAMIGSQREASVSPDRKRLARYLPRCGYG
jgi:hypothetical protein